MLQADAYDSTKAVSVPLVSASTRAANHMHTPDSWGYEVPKWKENTAHATLKTKLGLSQRPGSQTRLPWDQSLHPCLPSAVFLLHFEQFDLPAKILKGDFLISYCMISFRKQVDEDSIPSGEHVANG